VGKPEARPRAADAARATWMAGGEAPRQPGACLDSLLPAARWTQSVFCKIMILLTFLL
jgi:hypothetical protein